MPNYEERPAQPTPLTENIDFSVPPPPVPYQKVPIQETLEDFNDSDESYDREMMVQLEQNGHFVRPRPPPLNLSQDDTWEFEHYASCYSCQTHVTTPHYCMNRIELPTNMTLTEARHVEPQFVMPTFPLTTPTIQPLTPPQQFMLLSPLQPPITPFPFPAFQNPVTPTLVLHYPSPLPMSPALIHAVTPQQPTFFVFPEQPPNQEQD